jgi:hypothetical protein
MMPRSGSLAVLVAKRTLSPGSPLFANGVQVQAGKTYITARVVTNRFVTGIIFDSPIRGLIDTRIDENVSLVQDSQSRIVPGLANSSVISFESVNFPNLAFTATMC